VRELAGRKNLEIRLWKRELSWRSGSANCGASKESQIGGRYLESAVFGKSARLVGGEEVAKTRLVFSRSTTAWP
jgi:hypothetical protein